MTVHAFSDHPNSNRTHAALAEINITPLIDVMLVLLIIFMVVAPVASRTLDLGLAQATTVTPETQPHIVELIAGADGRYRLDGVAHDRMSLPGALARQAISDPDLVLRVDASGDADYQAFADALAAARDSGITRISHGP